MPSVFNNKGKTMRKHWKHTLCAAMVACGAYRDVAEAAAAIVRITETIVPDPALSARYDVQYEKYRKLYPSLKEVFPQLH